MSEGIRSGVNCTRPWRQRQRLRQRAHQQRLAEARHAFDQHVPRGHERHEHLLDDGVLTHHRLADGALQPLQQLSRLGDRVRLDFHGSTLSSDSGALLFDCQPAAHRLDERDGLPQLVRAARAAVIHGRPQRPRRPRR